MFVLNKQNLEKQGHKINIVLDIDGVLSAGYRKQSYNLKEYSRWESFFKAKNLFIEIEFDGKDQDGRGPIQHWDLCHFVNPAVPAFIKALFAIQNASITFYSSGDKRRNLPFVERLLRMSLGDSMWESVKSTVKIFSKDSLIDSKILKCEYEERFETFPYNECFFGNYKKDLLTILNSDQELDWTVIIDDDYSYVMPDQAKNLIKVKELTDYHYLHSPKRIEKDKQIDLKNSFDKEAFCRFNNIFYGMGILLTALEKMKEKNISLKEAIFLVQYTDIIKDLNLDLIISRSPHLADCYCALQENKYYYDIGLKYLKQYQADLNFFTTNDLLDYEVGKDSEVSKECYLESSGPQLI